MHLARHFALAVRKGRRVTDILLLLAITILYVAFCSRTYYWDGVSFALAIEAVYRGEAPFAVLFHPNHLLYNVFGYGLYASAQHLGSSVRAISLLQYANLIFSICCGYLVFRIARRWFRTEPVAYCCWLLFSFGALWWHFSTDADAYIVSTLLITASFFCLLQARSGFLILAGACHVLAMLFHELSVFFYVPVLALILQRASSSLQRRLLVCLGYVLLTAAIVALAYYACYRETGAGTAASFLSWIGSSSEDAHFRYSLGAIAGSNFNSYPKLFVGGKLSFLQQYASPPTVIALLFTLLALAYAVFCFSKHRDFQPVQPLLNSHYRTILISWLAPYVLFLSVWLPWNGFYKLFIWPPLVLLLGYLMNSRERLRHTGYGFSALILALAGWNFAGYIFPHSHDSADPVLALSKTIGKELPEQATIYYRQFVTDDWYLRYFTPGRSWKPLPALDTARSFADLLHSSSLVCFETSALSALRSQNGEDYRQLKAKKSSTYQWGLVSPKYDVRLWCANPFTMVSESHLKLSRTARSHIPALGSACPHAAGDSRKRTNL